MTQKDLEDKLDSYADKISSAVTDGVKRVEEAFDKGKDNLKKARDSEGGGSSSPKAGLVLIVAGILWLLYSLGVFSQPVFPILLIALGAFFVFRNR